MSSETPRSSNASPIPGASYRVDNGSRWPLSVHRAPAAMREADVNAMILAIDDLLRRREPHAIVLELDDAIDLPAVLRRKLAEQLTTRHDALVRYCRALSVIARTPNARGVLTALRWLVPAPSAERTFTNHLEAEQWALAQLKDARIARGG